MDKFINYEIGLWNAITIIFSHLTRICYLPQTFGLISSKLIFFAHQPNAYTNSSTTILSFETSQMIPSQCISILFFLFLMLSIST